MPFVKLNKSRSGAYYDNTEPQVRMGYRLQSDIMPSRAIYFALTQSAVAAAGWKAEERPNGRVVVTVDILEGTHDDAGFLMLMPDPKGYSFGTNRATGENATNTSLTCHIIAAKFKHYVMNDPDEIDPHVVEHSYMEGGILIQCPDWLRYNPLSLPVRQEPSPPRPTKDDADNKMLPMNRQQRRRLVHDAMRVYKK